MKSKIQIIESNYSDGLFSKNIKFYPDLEENVRIENLRKRRIAFGKKYGFDGLKMIQTEQKKNKEDTSYEDGDYKVVDKEIENFENKDDYWMNMLKTDLLLVTEKQKRITVGHIMADCPILIVEDRLLGVTGMAHSGASYINRNMAKNIVVAMQKEYGSKPENLYVYIGSYAHKENYVYDRWPIWATNPIWKKYIEEKDGNYYIDMKGAIVEQFNELGVKNIEVSPYDTATDDRHYSNTAAYHGNKKKNGQNYVGFFYK